MMAEEVDKSLMMMMMMNENAEELTRNSAFIGGGSATEEADAYHLDDYGKLRVLEPEVEQRTAELGDECRDFGDRTEELLKTAAQLLKTAEEFRDRVDREKMRAVVSRNRLQGVAKERRAKRRDVETMVAENGSQLERLRLHYASLLKVEAEQREFIEQFSAQK